MEYAHWHVEKWQNDGLDIQHDAPTDDDGDEETRMMSAAFRVEHRRSRYASEMEGSKRPRLVRGLRMLGDVTVTLPLGAAAIALLECLRLLIDMREAFMQQAWPTGEASEPIALDATVSREDHLRSTSTANRSLPPISTKLLANSLKTVLPISVSKCLATTLLAAQTLSLPNSSSMVASTPATSATSCALSRRMLRK
ncbi:hypothetical protein FRB93_009649 [Tulasnella sp. JGI-2019a]|nr:hypothetical protein FRB93_009649 [Tulasnella sp. JGI-2019a]